MPTNSSSSESISILERLSLFWEVLYIIFFIPFFANQVRISSTKTAFRSSQSQPFSQIWRENFPGRKSNWLPERDMPDQIGKVAIVTGGNTGIGYETVRALMRKGARVYMACRSQERAAKAIERLRQEGREWPGEVKFLQCDLADMESIRTASEELMRQESHLHILICNAGAANPGKGLKTVQGYDLTLGTNVLGHHQLILDLMPILEKTANSLQNNRSEQGGVRVHITSSWGSNVHQPSGFDVEDPEWSGPVKMNVLGIQFSLNPQGPVKEVLKYGNSKFLNIVQAKKFHRRYGDKGICFTSSDPGNNATELLRNRDSFMNMIWNYIVVPFFLFHPKYGAISQLYACTAPEAHILGGQYLAPWGKIVNAAPPSDDHRIQDVSFDWLNKQLTKNGY